MFGSQVELSAHKAGISNMDLQQHNVSSSTCSAKHRKCIKICVCFTFPVTYFMMNGCEHFKENNAETHQKLVKKPAAI